MNSKNRFNGVKIFSATMQRNDLSDAVTAWIKAHPQFEVVDIVVSQSSDCNFHCLSFCIFYWEPPSGK